MRRSIAISLLALVACLAWGPRLRAQEPGDEEARSAALQFGLALKQADPAALRSILPQRGKVQLRLQVLGPEEGSFSAGQVEALLQDFFSQGSARSFDLLSVEHDPRHYALARGRAVLVDRQGRPARVELHLAFQPEDGRWVLREIRETRP